MITSQVAIGRLSKETGAAVDDLQAFGMASEKLGGSLEGANSAIETLGTKLAAVNKGKEFPRAKMAATMLGMAMGGVGKAAAELGFKIFKGKGPIEALDMLADKLQEKHATFFEAKATLGRLGMGDAQIRMLIQGKDKMHELMEENEKYAASEEDIARSQEIEEVMKNLKFSIAKVTETIAQWALPVLKSLGEHFLQISDWAVSHGDTVKGVLIAMGAAAGWMALATVHATVLSMAHWVAHSTMAMVESGKIILAFFGVQFGAEKAGSATVLSMGKVVIGWITTGAQATIAGIKMAAAWVMGLGPIAWIIAGVAAVIAIFVGLEMKFHIFSKLWGWIKTAAADSLDWIGSKVKAIGKFITDYFIAPFKILANLLSGNFKGALATGMGLVKDVGSIVGMDAGAGLPAYAGASGGSSYAPPAAHHAVAAHHYASAAAAVHPSVVSRAASTDFSKTIVKHTSVGDVIIHVSDETYKAGGAPKRIADDIGDAVDMSEGGMS